MKTIYLASDHGGYQLKIKIKKYLIENAYDIVDLTPRFDPNDDYPEIAHKIAAKVANNLARGILICGTGIGMSITANKHRNIRAAVIVTKAQALLARLHNDLNILCLGGLNLLDLDEARLRNKNYDNLIDLGLQPNSINQTKELIDIFLNTEFEGGRHKRRTDKMEIRPATKRDQLILH